MTDVQTLRKRSRQDIQSGAVTPSYGADRGRVVQVLNEALATEMVCVLRYKRHYFMAKGLPSQSVAQEFLQHAKEEEQHADMIAERTVQLGGEPGFLVDRTRRAQPRRIRDGRLADRHDP